MTKPNINSKKGFTIIEVVLVLAIAGLIFLMVFIALPNLQRTRRDTQRRNDVDRLSAALVQYVANNNKLPEVVDDIVSGSVFEDESGGQVDSLPASTESTPINSLHKFYWKYLLAGGSDTFEDPDGGHYNLLIANCDVDATNGGCEDVVLKSSEASSPLNESYDIATNIPTASSNYTMVIATEATCGNEEETGGIIQPVTGTRRFAVAMLLEGSGVYCVNN